MKTTESNPLDDDKLKEKAIELLKEQSNDNEYVVMLLRKDGVAVANHASIQGTSQMMDAMLHNIIMTVATQMKHAGETDDCIMDMRRSLVTHLLGIMDDGIEEAIGLSPSNMIGRTKSLH